MNTPQAPHDERPPAETADPVADAYAAMRWASSRFGGRLCVTASFGDATLAHVVNSAVPGVEITLLDTGYLFAETEWFADDLRARYGLNIRIIRPAIDLEQNVWQSNTDACCAARKIEPLDRALDGRDGWVTGLRRSDSDARRKTPIVRRDLMRGVIKINPLAAWTDSHIEEYSAAHNLPEHPLVDRGYESIGCWPCTRPVSAGEDPRCGRWAGSEKTECGLHL